MLGLPWFFSGLRLLYTGSGLHYRCYCCCSVTKSCLTLLDPMDWSTPGFPVPHHLPEFAQVHVHWVSDAIQPFHPLSPSSLSAFNLSQHQGLCQWVSCSHQVAKVLELQFHTSYEIKVLLLSKRQPKSLKTTILGNSVSRCRWPPLRPTSSQVSPEGTCLFKNGGPRGGWTGGKMTKRRQSSTFDTCR